jgi:hypothetical protein
MRRFEQSVIGVDFDNTIVTYDDLMYRIALERGLIPADTARNKKHIRDTIRSIPNGESEWQMVQAIAYGKRILEARLNNGVSRFFLNCRHNNIPVYIVSHKTMFASLGDRETDLRAAALRWMETTEIFDDSGIGLPKDHVYFENTRREKIQRITELRCTHFIDDLEETFLEDSFPSTVQKILFVPAADSSPSGVNVFRTWDEISKFVFNAD